VQTRLRGTSVSSVLTQLNIILHTYNLSVINMLRLFSQINCLSCDMIQYAMFTSGQKPMVGQLTGNLLHGIENKNKEKEKNYN